MSGLQPIIAIGAVLVKENKVLLVKRGKPPNQDRWAIPGGKVRNGERLMQAAERELWEETGIKARAGALIHVVEHVDHVDAVPQFHYVIIDFLMQYIEGEAHCGDDAAAVAWFTPGDIVNAHDIEEKTAQFLAKWWANKPRLETW